MIAIAMLMVLVLGLGVNVALTVTTFVLFIKVRKLSRHTPRESTRGRRNNLD